MIPPYLCLFLAILFLGKAIGDPAPTPASSVTGSGLEDEWSMVLIKEKAFGYQHNQITQVDGNYSTLRHEETVISRAGTHLRTSEDCTIVEDDQGKVLSFDRSFTAPDTSGHLTGTRVGNDFAIKTVGGKDSSTACAVGVLGPAAIQRKLQSLPLKPGFVLELSEFSLDHIQTATAMKMTVVKKETHLIDTTSQSLWQVTLEETGSASPPVTYWMDDNHQVISQERAVPGLGALVIRPSTQGVCKQPIDGIELFASSMIRPNETLVHIDRLGRVDYLLSVPGLTSELPLWKDDTSTQEVTKSLAGSAYISVYGDSFVPELASYTLPILPSGFPADMKPYLQPSHYLESDSVEVKILAQQAAGVVANPVVAARKIETFVREYITRKDLRLGFISARSTAIAREGDCKEHAVLCAAMGRALGMPTRCVIGLCYEPPNPQLDAQVSGDVSHGIFGFHMWAEAYIAPGQWMPMDAATYGYDVGHIAILKTALDEAEPDFETVIDPIVGHLSITILKTDLTSRPLLPPKPTAPPVQVAPGVD